MTEIRRSRAGFPDPATSTPPSAENNCSATPHGATEGERSTVPKCRENGTVEHRRDTKYWCLGLDGKWRPNRRFDTTSRDYNIVRLRTTGWSMRDIAAEIGCSVGTVHRVIAQWVWP